ncbi:MAG TPA: hypothetical protein VGH19_22860 [Verrucomicrobiae bacterium]
MFNQVVPSVSRLLASAMLLAWNGVSAFAAAPGPLKETAAPTFAWPAPMQFQVEEAAQVNGNKTVFRHTLSFTRAENDYLLTWVETKCVEVAGQKIKGEKLKNEVRPLEAMMSSRPPLRISSTGEYIGAVMSPEVIAKLVKQREQAFPEKTAENKKYAAELNSPAGMETFGRSLGQHWNAWVGQWRKAPLAENTSTTSQVPMFLGQDIFVFGELMHNNLGKAKGTGGQVRLTSDELTTGPKYARALSNAMGGFELTRPTVISAERHVAYETVTDLATLLPSTASRKSVMMVELEGKTPSTKVEEYGYRFFWPDAAKVRKSEK